MLLKVLLLSLSASVFGLSDTDTLAFVGTANGQIRGSTKRTLLIQRPYFSFKGIPYAKIPIGDLRFKVKKCHI